MGYAGAATIADLQERGQLTRITSAGPGREPPARHPDDRRGAELQGPLSMRARDTVEIGLNRFARRGYDLDEVSIVPSRRTRDVDDVSTAWQIDAFRFDIPLITSPSDAVVSPATAVAVGEVGGLGVLNAEGLWTRYDDPEPVYRAAREDAAGAGAPPVRAAAGGLRRAGQARPDHRADQGDARRRRAPPRSASRRSTRCSSPRPCSRPASTCWSSRARSSPPST